MKNFIINLKTSLYKKKCTNMFAYIMKLLTRRVLLDLVIMYRSFEVLIWMYSIEFNCTTV